MEMNFRFPSFWLLGLMLLGLTTGCVQMQPLTPEEQAQVRRVHLKYDFGDRIEYVKIGTTVFNNKRSETDGEAIMARFKETLAAKLEQRGYVLVDTLAEADVGVVVQSQMTYNYPSEIGVEGAGFFVHIMFGINPGILAETGYTFRLMRSETGDQRHAQFIQINKKTDVNTNAGTWYEFSAEERDQMLGVLEQALAETADAGFDAILLTGAQTAPAMGQPAEAAQE